MTKATSRTHRSIGDGLFFVLLAIVLNSTSVARATWVQDTAATIDEITSTTTLPAYDGLTEDSRTTIGLKESVTCEIDPATWADTDCEVGVGVQNDTIGNKTWSVQGVGTIASTTGDSTLMTADATPGNVTVHCTIYDSGTRFSDTAVARSKPFTVVAPSSLTVNFWSDGTMGPEGTEFVGAQSTFTYFVEPDNVNFGSAELQRSADEQDIEWPNGSTTTTPGFNYGITLDSTGMFAVNHIAYRESVDRLLRGGTYDNCTPNQSRRLEYKNTSAQWVNCVSYQVLPSYRGSDLKTRVSVQATVTADGTYMGPWGHLIP